MYVCIDACMYVCMYVYPPAPGYHGERAREAMPEAEGQLRARNEHRDPRNGQKHRKRTTGNEKKTSTKRDFGLKWFEQECLNKS